MSLELSGLLLFTFTPLESKLPTFTSLPLEDRRFLCAFPSSQWRFVRLGRRLRLYKYAAASRFGENPRQKNASSFCFWAKYILKYIFISPVYILYYLKLDFNKFSNRKFQIFKNCGKRKRQESHGSRQVCGRSRAHRWKQNHQRSPACHRKTGAMSKYTYPVKADFCFLFH